MNSVILSKTYDEPPFCKREILRYAGCKEADGEIETLLDGCIKEVSEKLSYKVCYRELPLNIEGSVCDFTAFNVNSKSLALNLEGCKSVIVFAATVGVELDRLITKYGHISPARAVMMDAIGAERIEALCEAFCKDIKGERKTALKPRFSAGYGDLPLDVQRNIFSVLDPLKRIGLSLNDSLLMSPSKSVTAFIGITEGKTQEIWE